MRVCEVHELHREDGMDATLFHEEQSRPNCDDCETNDEGRGRKDNAKKVDEAIAQSACNHHVEHIQNMHGETEPGGRTAAMRRLPSVFFGY